MVNENDDVLDVQTFKNEVKKTRINDLDRREAELQGYLHRKEQEEREGWDKEFITAKNLKLYVPNWKVFFKNVVSFILIVPFFVVLIWELLNSLMPTILILGSLALAVAGCYIATRQL